MSYLLTMYVGDTSLDIYGSKDDDDPSVGHIGAIDIEDVCIANTQISVLEMIHSLNWDKFQDQVDCEYQNP